MPNIAADNNPASPHAGALYVVWDRQTFSADKSKIALEKSEMILVRSTDDGKTWTAPKAFTQPYPTTLGHTTAVANDGTLYVMFAVLRDAAWDMMLTVSKDGGETFSPPAPVARSDSGSNVVANFPRPGGWPIMALDPRGSGKVFVVFGDSRHGDRDILCTTSSDGGTTWSAPVRVNDDPKGNGRDQVMQWLAVDPKDGAAYVIFYDRRSDPKNLLPTVTLARSTEHGRKMD